MDAERDAAKLIKPIDTFRKNACINACIFAESINWYWAMSLATALILHIYVGLSRSSENDVNQDFFCDFQKIIDRMNKNIWWKLDIKCKKYLTNHQKRLSIQIVNTHIHI